MVKAIRLKNIKYNNLIYKQFSKKKIEIKNLIELIICL